MASSRSTGSPSMVAGMPSTIGPGDDGDGDAEDGLAPTPGASEGPPDGESVGLVKERSAMAPMKTSTPASAATSARAPRSLARPITPTLAGPARSTSMAND